MVSPVTVLQTIFAFLSGPFGAGLIGILLLVAFFRLAAEHRLHYFVYAVLGGIGVFSVAWIMSNWLSSGGVAA